MAGLTTFGKRSKTTILISEPNKVTVTLTASAAIKKGQLVKLTNDGAAALWATSDARIALLGFAASDAAIGEKVTIWTRGYGMIRALSNAAFNAGPVTYNSYDSSTSVDGTTGYSVYKTTSTETESTGWSLDKPTGANQMIRVLLRD